MVLNYLSGLIDLRTNPNFIIKNKSGRISGISNRPYFQPKINPAQPSFIHYNDNKEEKI